MDVTVLQGFVSNNSVSAEAKMNRSAKGKKQLRNNSWKF